GFEDQTRTNPQNFRVRLLQYLDELDKLIDERVIQYEELQMKEREVKAIKEIEKRLNEQKMQTQESLVTEGATFNSGNEADAEKILVKTVAFGIEHADIGPLYDSDTVSELSKVEGCGGLGGSRLTWGDKEVTMQYLELKGGDRGACKLLGDVIEVLGCLLEPFDNASSGYTSTFIGVGVGPDVYGGTSILQGVFSLLASSSLSSHDRNAQLYLDVFGMYSHFYGGSLRQESITAFRDGAGDPFRSYSSLCLANAGKRQVVDSPRTAPISSLHLVGSHCSKLLQKGIGLHATDLSRNVQNMSMNAEGSAFAHNEASDYIVSSVSIGVKRTVGKSQVILTSFETNSLNRTARFTPIDSNMSAVHSGELQRATRPVNAEGCTSAVATDHVVSSVLNPQKRTAANSQLMLTSVEASTSKRTRRFSMRDSNMSAGHSGESQRVSRRTNAEACSSAAAVGRSYTYVDLGDCTQRCRYCGASFWYGERLKGRSHGQRVEYHMCCSEGRIYMQQPLEPPEYIKQLFQNKHFMENIRAYNQMFAMTSFGAKIDESINAGRGPYVFKVSGQVYHWIGSLCPTVGETPKFLQLYIYDTENEVANRMSHFGGMDDSRLDPQIVEGLIHFLDAHNELVQLFRTARDKCREMDIPEFKIRLYNAEGVQGYELPTSNTLGAMVFESGITSKTDFDVIIQYKEGPLQRVNKLHPSYMSLQFPLLFIRGQSGYHTELKLRSADGSKKAKRVTMLTYYRYQLHFRLSEYELIFRGGRLFQQYVVSVFCAVEQNRLDFIRKKQNDIRSDYLSGLYDAISRGERDGYEVGGRIILPMSFTGGPRYMYAHYLDALAILLYTVEFQKRGLPHCHTLLWVDSASKIRMPEEVDRFISAELPDPAIDPDGYRVVSELMMHGPCGDANLKASFPYNRDLLLAFEAHINVEYCGPIGSSSVETEPSQQVVDEIQNYIEGHFVCTHEAYWRIFKFDIHHREPTVQTLSVHLEDMHLTYLDFPSEFVWYGDSKTWSPRRNCRSSIGHLAYVHPTSGELFFLQMLLCHQKGCRYFKEVQTVVHVLYPTYRAACEAMGLLGDDREWEIALEEACVSATSPELRSLFSHILLHCDVADPCKLWTKFWKEMGHDIPERVSDTVQITNYHLNDDAKQGHILYEIEIILSNCGKSLQNFGLPLPPQDLLAQLNNRLLMEERNYNRGHGGTGKTFLWKTLISALRSEGKIILAVASSGIASLLLPSGRTAHSRFKLPLELTEESLCRITKNTQLGKLLIDTNLIIWDEAPMNDRRCFEVLDRTLRDILNAPFSLFGGKSVLLGGDFCQTLPVKKGASKMEVISSCISESELWSSFKVFTLKENMRLARPDISLEERSLVNSFASWLLDIGDGKIGEADEKDLENTSWIDIPPQYCVPPDEQGLSNLIDFIYDQSTLHTPYVTTLQQKAIICPKNETADIINSKVLDMVSGKSTTYISNDETTSTGSDGAKTEMLYPLEHLNTLKLPGFPPMSSSSKLAHQ
ncbi:DNA helicase, partial [Tanacetum coccineum]